MSGERVLLVDLGNTRLKWAVLRDGKLGPVVAVPHAANVDDAPVIAAWDRLAAPSRVLVGSVAGPERDGALTGHCRQLWNLEPRFVAAGAQALGVRSGYDAPEKLGVDRWLALLAAHADGCGAACVVDCGTAVTIDVLDDAGCHRGGLIVPGLQLMGDCLRSRTRIPPFAMPEPCAALGRETGAAIANGALLAVVGAVRETRALAQRILGGTPRLIVAGGAGDVVAAALAEPSERRPDLVLEGLAALARVGDE